MAWLFLILASLMETAWFMCIRALRKVDFGALKQGRMEDFLGDGWALVALVGYGVFGVLNAWFLFKAMKHIPSSTAFGVWTGLALAEITLVDAWWLDLPLSLGHFVCMSLLLWGVLGLKQQDKADTGN